MMIHPALVVQNPPLSTVLFAKSRTAWSVYGGFKRPRARHRGISEDYARVMAVMGNDERRKRKERGD
jgi:hypothetical protein